MESSILNNAFFWQKIDTIYNSSNLIVTRQKDESHPLYPNMVYPTQYGYLEDTCSDGKGIEVFKGSLQKHHVDAAVICMDILKKDLTVKLLMGCSKEEEEMILHFVNQTDYQKAILVRKNDQIPGWAISE